MPNLKDLMIIIWLAVFLLILVEKNKFTKFRWKLPKRRLWFLVEIKDLISCKTDQKYENCKISQNYDEWVKTLEIFRFLENNVFIIVIVNLYFCKTQ